MTPRPSSPPRNAAVHLAGRHRSRGFSLIELMVAVVLGIIVTLGIITVFAGTQESLTTVRGQARIQENGRYALDFMSRALRATGYLGCVSTRVTVFNALGVPVTAIPFGARITEPLFSFQATSPAIPSSGTDGNPGTWSPALNDATSGLPTAGAGAIDIATIRPGTDVLVVRSASNEALRFNASQGAANANLVVQAPTDPTRFANGTVVLVSDCNKATVFQISTATVGGPNLTVQHHVGGPAPGNAGEVLTENADSFFDLDSTLYRVSSSVFYIAPGAGTNNRNAQTWSLWRQTDSAAPVELVEGVHDLQLRYGVDLDDDGIPNAYQTFQEVTPAQRASIVMVRVTVGTDSVDAVSTTNGGTAVLNRNFNATVAVRNRVL